MRVEDGFVEAHSEQTSILTIVVRNRSTSGVRTLTPTPRSYPYVYNSDDRETPNQQTRRSPRWDGMLSGGYYRKSRTFEQRLTFDWSFHGHTHDVRRMLFLVV